MGGGVKSKTGQPIELALRRTQFQRGLQIELRSAVKDLPRSFACFAIGKFVNIPPVGEMSGQTKAPNR